MIKTLSVIIPVYKVTENKTFKYFDELIESISINIKNLEHSAQLKEIIIVNDYTEMDPYDSIKLIFDKYNLNDKLIYIHNKENLGQAMARNIGAKKAKGSFLHFIDQDDYISDNFYSFLLKKDQGKIIFGYPRLFSISKNSFINGIKFTADILFKRIKYLSGLRVLLLNNIAFSPGQYIIEKNIFFQVNGFPDLKNKGCDDYGILFNLAFINKIRIGYNRKAEFTYRIHESQSRKTLNMKNSLIEFFDKRKENTVASNYLKKFKIGNYKYLRLISYLCFFNRCS